MIEEQHPKTQDILAVDNGRFELWADGRVWFISDEWDRFKWDAGTIEVLRQMLNENAEEREA